jgi:hypothetical protein
MDSDSETDDAGARPPPTPPAPMPTGPPLVPKTDCVFEVLTNLKHDFFTVSPIELERKASDELTLGLHWYVLFTLIHNAADTTGRAKIFFLSKRGQGQLLADGADEFEPSAEDQQLMIHTDTDSNMRRDIKIFDEYAPTKDVRLLLKHIQKVNSKGHCRDLYYNPSCESYAANALSCVRYFIHNCKYSPRSADAAAGTFAAISLREVRRVVYAITQFGNLCDALTNKMSAALSTIPKIREVCTALKKAAADHFRRVKGIIAVFTSLYPSAPPVHSLGCGEMLALIQEDMRDDIAPEDGAPRISTMTQFALYGLWTRFGVRHGEAGDSPTAGDDAEGPLIATQQPHLRTVTVTRFSLTTPNAAGIYPVTYLSKTASFLTDPIGATNWDILNRAIDLTHAAVRQCLVLVAIRYEQEKIRPALVKELMDHLTTFESRTVLEAAPETGDAAIQFRDAPVYIEKNLPYPEKIMLSKHFMTAYDIRKGGANGLYERRRELFIKFSPYWADLRKLAEVMSKLHTLAERQLLFPYASTVVKIRDTAAHHLNLHRPRTLDSNKVVEDVKVLIQHVKSMEQFGVEPMDTVEFRALIELQDSLPHYRRWRKRQFVATSQLTAEAQRLEAVHAVHGLLNSLGEDNFLRPLSDADNSPDALRAVLSLLKVEDAPQPAAGAAGPRRKIVNIFDVFGDDSDSDEED